MKDKRRLLVSILLLIAVCIVYGGDRFGSVVQARSEQKNANPSQDLSQVRAHGEFPSDPPAVRSTEIPEGVVAGNGFVERNGFVSMQVNVNEFGNIPGDAANEPSIAIDPTAMNTVVIGWRQFDSIHSDFRQAGYSYSHDGGLSWVFPGVLTTGVFSSDPILNYDAEGRIYYYSLQFTRGPGSWACYMFRSEDGGVNWPQEVYAYGGDKAWMTIDRTGGIGHGNVYVFWSNGASCCEGTFTRSVNGGSVFSFPTAVSSSPQWGTLDVGPDGELYIGGNTPSGIQVVKSMSAQDPNKNPVFEQAVIVNLGGPITAIVNDSPNPVGLLGQVNIAVDRSDGPRRGFVYVLASVDPPGIDPLDVMFIRSADGGLTWSDPIRVNDDAVDNGAWQWFGTMSVSPTGRLDVIFNDTRSDPSATFSELYYVQSSDGGLSWSTNEPVSPSFNHFLGYPQQNKLGDYYDMISDTNGAHIAYAATFNGEQDVYYLRIGQVDCNENGVPDDQDVTDGTSEDCDGDSLPDECGRDCNTNGTLDMCDIQSGFSEDCNENFVPDLCEPNFDGDALIDGCDFDIDGDGISNANDLCEFTTLGSVVQPVGAAMGDGNRDCVIDWDDVLELRNCLNQSGPGFPTGRACRERYDYDFNRNIDLRDVSKFMLAFEGS